MFVLFFLMVHNLPLKESFKPTIASGGASGMPVKWLAVLRVWEANDGDI